MSRTDWQIRNGTHGSGDLGTAYALVNFPAQTDMAGTARWEPPTDPRDRVRAAAYHQSLFGDVQPYGGDTWEWILPYLTPDMYAYWYTTILGASFSDLVTARTWVRGPGGGAWAVKNARAILTTPDQLETAGGGYINVPVKFIRGSTAA